MRVLIADALPAAAVAELATAGFEVRSDPSLKDATLTQALRDFGPEVLVVRSTRVTAQMLGAAGTLGLIVRAGAGTNTIAVEEAAARGVYVANCPGRNSAAVAELAFGLMVTADRRIPNAVRDLRRGLWRKKYYASAHGLAGRTLGLLGLGGIGMEMVRRARGFAMPVIAWSRSLTPARASELGVTRAASPLDVARADVVSVHVALCDETRHLVDAEFLSTMRQGAILINTSRGAVVDQDALLHAVRNRDLRAGLDVFDDEPAGGEGVYSGPLQAEDHVFVTPHIGASTSQAQEAVASEATRIIRAYRDDGNVPNCVNLCEGSPATHMLVVRHKDEVGVLAGVLDVLRGAEINVQEMENIIFAGARAAVARIRLDRSVGDPILDRIRNFEQVLAVSLVELQ
jgi:D-3-phosphoglycerate dehydrogenase